MESRVPHVSASAAYMAAACSFSAFAQPVPLINVVVTATRAETRVQDLVSDVTVIKRATIESLDARSLPELLQRVAGVQIATNGGLGKASSVFIRGAEARHTILLVDGVRLGSATLGTPSWDNIPVDMIERIEVLKGPASALYGSDAAGGVVQIFLKKGREGLHPSVSVGAGSRGRIDGAAGVQAGEGPLTYAMGVQKLRENGFSATNSKVPFGAFNPDRDPFEQEAADASIRYQISNGWTFDAGLLYSDGISAFDDGPHLDSRLRLRDATLHATLEGQLTSLWRTKWIVSEGDDTSNTIVATFPGSFKTTQRQLTWQNEIELPLGRVLAGLEQHRQRVSSSTLYAITRRTIDSAFLGLNGETGNQSWQANVRHDSNSQFGSHDTGFAGYGYRITPAWRVHASYGTSFVAPSFNQLYFPNFANPALQPEHGHNTDVGVRWAHAGQEVGLVRYANRIRGFITSTTAPANIPRARIDGWTLDYKGQLRGVTVRAALDLLDPRNELTGRLLPRRSKRQLTVAADRSFGAWTLGASALYVDKRYDDTANTRELAAYTTVDVYADWLFAPAWTAQTRITNLTDRHYETAYGYNQPSRGVYVALKWAPQ
jgi:vitamin B12 transporter